MRKEIVKNKKGKVIAEVYLFLDKLEGNKKEIIKRLIKEVLYSKKIGYAGYRNREGLRNSLDWSIFQKKKGSKFLFKLKKLEIEEIKGEIRVALKKCVNILNAKTYVFVFPTLDRFVRNKMGGVSGYCIWKNTILIFVYPKNVKKSAMKQTICHEFAHAVSPYYHIFNSKNIELKDAFVAEGIAEHFREHIVGGKRAAWSKSLTKNKARIIFRQIKPLLSLKNEKLHQQLFFGTGKYPLWTGYAIGYYIVEEYLEKQKKIDWKKVLRMKPEEIIKQTKSFR